jgi:hypothetical protein
MAAIKKSSMRLWIKLLAGSMAFLPMALYFLVGAFFAGRVPSNHIVHYIVVGSALFNFPAFSILALVKTYHVSKVFELLSLVGLMLLWSSIIAWVFWRIASTFLGEDEPDYETNPDGAKFDWVGFRVRFGVAIRAVFCQYGNISYHDGVDRFVCRSCVRTLPAKLLEASVKLISSSRGARAAEFACDAGRA